MREQDRIIRQLETQFGIKASQYSVHPSLGQVKFFLPNRRLIVLLHVPVRNERAGPGRFKLQVSCPVCGKPVWSEPLITSADLDQALNGQVGPDGQHRAICKKSVKGEQEDG